MPDTAGTAPKNPPDVLLFMTTTCPHCPGMLQGLGTLIKAGHIGRLEVINLSLRPEAGKELGVRSVPWVRIGPFVLEGLRSQSELQQWAERAMANAGMTAYFAELLTAGDLKKVLALVVEDATRFAALLQLLANPGTALHVRVGIGAVMEDLQGSDILRHQVEPLIELTHHTDARIRSDACHYLALTQAPQALAAARGLLNDPDPQVRDVAQDSVAVLQQAK